MRSDLERALQLAEFEQTRLWLARGQLEVEIADIEIEVKGLRMAIARAGSEPAIGVDTGTAGGGGGSEPPPPPPEPMQPEDVLPVVLPPWPEPGSAPMGVGLLGDLLASRLRPVEGGGN